MSCGAKKIEQHSPLTGVQKQLCLIISLKWLRAHAIGQIFLHSAQVITLQRDESVTSDKFRAFWGISD